MRKKKKHPSPIPKLNFPQSKGVRGSRIDFDSVLGREEYECELGLSKVLTPIRDEAATTSSCTSSHESGPPHTTLGGVVSAGLARKGSSNLHGYCSSNTSAGASCVGEISSPPSNAKARGGAASHNPPVRGHDGGANVSGQDQVRQHSNEPKIPDLVRTKGVSGISLSPLQSDCANSSKGPLNSKGKKLGYICPIVKNGKNSVNFQASDLHKEAQKWQFSIVLYVVGMKPSYNAIRNYVHRQWSNFANPSIFLHDEGYFVIKLGDNSELNEIMSNGPYSFTGKPVVIKPWSANFVFQSEIFRVVPIWVRFPNLPLNCWLED